VKNERNSFQILPKSSPACELPKVHPQITPITPTKKRREAGAGGRSSKSPYQNPNALVYHSYFPKDIHRLRRLRRQKRREAGAGGRSSKVLSKTPMLSSTTPASFLFLVCVIGVICGCSSIRDFASNSVNDFGSPTSK